MARGRTYDAPCQVLALQRSTCCAVEMHARRKIKIKHDSNRHVAAHTLWEAAMITDFDPKSNLHTVRRSTTRTCAGTSAGSGKQCTGQLSSALTSWSTNLIRHWNCHDSWTLQRSRLALHSPLHMKHPGQPAHTARLTSERQGPEQPC